MSCNWYALNWKTCFYNLLNPDMLFRCLLAEMQKSRRSMAVWLASLGTLANVLIFAALAIFDESKPIANWADYFAVHYEGIAFMMLPLFVIILCSLVTYPEHRTDTWVLLRTLPVGVGPIYFSKYLFMLGLFFLAHLAFVAGMLGSGWLLGWLHSDFSGLHQMPDWSLLGQLIGQTLLSVLGLLSLHYWLSLMFRPFIISLTIGILGFVATLLLQDQWPLLWLLPYAPPVEYVRLLDPAQTLPLRHGLYLGLWASLAYSVLFLLGGYVWFVNKR